VADGGGSATLEMAQGEPPGARLDRVHAAESRRGAKWDMLAKLVSSRKIIPQDGVRL